MIESWCIEKENLAFSNDQERFKATIKICQESKDPMSLVCSDSVSMNAKRLEEATEK